MTESLLDRVASTLIMVCVTVGLLASVCAVVLAFLGAPVLFLVGGVVGAVGWSWVAIFCFPEDE